MRKVMICAVLVLVTAFTVNASAVTIDFDALGNGAVVTNQFAEATFPSSAGYENRTSGTYDFGAQFSPYYICTAPVGGSLNCLAPTIVDFTNPVNNLSFYALGDDAAGIQAVVQVYENGALSGTVNVIVDGSFYKPDLVDLTGFSNVTRIVIGNITDSGGLAWDLFRFDVVSVPEPTTILLLGSGLLGLWGFRRKSKK